MLPSYAGHYDLGPLCAAVQVRDLPFTDFLLANRPRLADYDALEGTAVGLAAMSGDVNLLQKKLLNHFQVVWELNSAFLPPLGFHERHSDLFFAL